MKDPSSDKKVQLLEGRLEDYNPQDYYNLHVIDTDPSKFAAQTQVGDPQSIPKFVLSPEREATRIAALKAAKQLKMEEEDRKQLTVQIGERCLVSSANAPKRSGLVMFVGSVHWATGLWVGIQFDDPVGRNDGEAKGVRYFTCPQNHGSFVKPSFVSPQN